ncbi:MAG: hypothetical protein BZY81_08230 [SAR202 cluster bacterium Io17-Chloro-G4]|nr:MAG: hypothetical protein BZY81_08230 [SAR202 cluster bacterium Io17-Chloro-G4]
MIQRLRVAGFAIVTKRLVIFQVSGYWMRLGLRRLALWTEAVWWGDFLVVAYKNTSAGALVYCLSADQCPGRILTG